MALLNVKDVSAWIQVKPSTIYLWVAQGKIPALKIHGVIRFRLDDIAAWLEGCQIEPPNLSRQPGRPRRGTDDVDTLIARAKAEVYTSCRGKPDQDRATRKGEPNGSV
ncbi:MAG: helix-turn-helix domain-containing protein [Nitrospiraceae bacterium]|nr:helix-turn-helix domain-containing protein [Nitrospiraceae bacterium]